MQTRELSKLTIYSNLSDSDIHFELSEDILNEEEDDVPCDIHIPYLTITKTDEFGNFSKTIFNLERFSNLKALKDSLDIAISKYENG